MTKYRILIIVVFIAVTFHEAPALKCWRCSSDAANAAFCDDPFDESIITEQQRRWSYTECSYPPNNGRTRAVCKKVKQLINDKAVISRSCFWEDVNAPSDSCNHTNTPSYIKTEYCHTCTTDGCNGASQNFLAPAPMPGLAPGPAAVTFQGASSLKCWRCASDASNGDFCDDPFDESIITEQQKRWSYVECSYPPIQGYQYNSAGQTRPVCKKVKQLINDKTVVSRSCFWEDVNAPSDSCYNANTPSYIKTLSCHTCTTDGCNGASQNEPAPHNGQIIVKTNICILFLLSLTLGIVFVYP
jgi:hypothetical protein